jgi:hypothetical protein
MIVVPIPPTVSITRAPYLSASRPLSNTPIVGIILVNIVKE